MSIYDLYKTDPQKEKEGVPLLFADEELRITIARAGGSNTKYDRIVAANCKPYKRAIQSDLLSTDKATAILSKTFAEAVVVKWETKVDGEFKEGIELEGLPGLHPVNVENIVQVFRALPDLFEEVKTEATKMNNFKTAIREEDAKN